MNRKALILVIVLFPSLAPCQDTKPGGEVTEEIIVHGEEYDLKDLNIAIRTTEKDMYELFNSINEDDKFDVYCERRAYTGSKIKKQLCFPRYYHDAAGNQARSELADLRAVRSDPPLAQNATQYIDPQFSLRLNQEKWNEKMAAAINKDTKLMKLFIRYMSLREEYAEKSGLVEE